LYSLSLSLVSTLNLQRSSLNIPDSNLVASSLRARRVLSSLFCWSFASLSPPS
ncbi:hypothetical protein S83_071381, partial [Arachis hypogaea]